VAQDLYRFVEYEKSNGFQDQGFLNEITRIIVIFFPVRPDIFLILLFF